MNFKQRNIYENKLDHIFPKVTKERLLVYGVFIVIMITMIILGIGDSKLYRTSLITANQQKILVESARNKIGVPYVLGADSPPTRPVTYDCSSLMVDVFDDLNIQLPRVSKEQYKVGKRVTQEEALPGDMIFFDTFNAGRVTHVGIITKKDPDGKLWMVDANSQVNKVVEEKISGKYWRNAFEGVKRINEFSKDVVENIDDTKNEKPQEILPPSEMDDPRVQAVLEENENLQTAENKSSVSSHITFTDLEANYPYREAILALANQGIIKGIGNDKFGPYMTITRAELLKITLKMNKTSQVGKSVNLYDIKKHWVEPYVKTAVAKGYIKGYEDNTFRPNNVVNRQEASKIILEASRKTNKFEKNENFTDVSPDHWVSKYASIIKENNLLPLNGNSFEPIKGLTRGEAAELIYNISRM